MTQKTARRIYKRIWFWSAMVIVILAAACIIYVSDYYRADAEVIAAFGDAAPAQVLADGSMTFGAADAETGLIFYPGGKVEYSAYAPLMARCAEQGIFCVLVEMPFHLAVLDAGAAAEIPAKFPEVGSWYLGGHSLGGSMAAACLADHPDLFAGLILLGAYSTEDLSGIDSDVLSIYGSEDRVLNRENYEKYRPNLPEGFTELVIEGGCHAGFGLYGPQRGDGTPVISGGEQIAFTADAIGDFIETQQYRQFAGCWQVSSLALEPRTPVETGGEQLVGSTITISADRGISFNDTPVEIWDCEIVVPEHFGGSNYVYSQIYELLGYEEVTVVSLMDSDSSQLGLSLIFSENGLFVRAGENFAAVGFYAVENINRK